MTRLVLSPRHTSDSQRMWRAAIDAGWDVQRVESREWAQGASVEDLANVVLYGESMFVESMASRCGIELLAPPDDVLVQLPVERVCRQIVLTTLAQARAMETFPRFVKPPADKSFRAAVYASPVTLAVATAHLPDDTAVLVSEPVTFEVEYRSFVSDGAVAAISIYLRDGELAEVDEAWPCDPSEMQQARETAEQIVPLVAGTYVLDVGRIRGRGWAAVEMNPLWGSGLLGVDARAVLGPLRASMRWVSTDQRRPG